MLGLPLLRKSSITAECDQCRTRFDPSEGGVCAVCQRILCGEHLHGSWLRRMRVELGASPVCVDCRAGGGPPAPVNRK
jgi:hypothetical protein